jgi:ATP-dependent RNA helicase RhlE
MLFSATMPAEIRGLANSLLNDPHVVELNHSTPVASVSHFMYATDQDGKLPLLKELLSDDSFVSAIVFTRTKHRAKRIALQLDRSGHRAVALQGNMSQAQRTRAMNGFRRAEFKILVATDIAARGIDVEHVSHVVNFDMPDTPDAYTHRIGRTGRADRAGKAINFITADDRYLARTIETRIDAPVTKDASLDFSADRSPAKKRQRFGGSWAPKNRRRFL